QDGRGLRRPSRHERQAYTVKGAGEETGLPSRRARVQRECRSEIAALLGDAPKQIVADAELRATLVAHRGQGLPGARIVQVILAEARQHERLRRPVAEGQHLLGTLPVLL